MRARTADAGCILVLGDINVDLLARVKAWPRPGQDCLAPRLELHCGGVGANCALALARWGVQARLLGCLGRDAFGDHLLDALEQGGLDTQWVQRTGEAITGLMYISITPDGQRTFFGSRGANGFVRRLAANSRFFASARAAHLVGYNFLNPMTEQAAKHILKTVRARGGWVSLDVGMAPSVEVPRKILRAGRNVDILFASRDEAAALTGTRDPRKAFAWLKRNGAREVVLKLGKRGCLIAEEEEIREVPAFPVRTVDSTGAGDAFVAAFLQARLRNWPAAEAALAANAAGAAAATVVGAGRQLPAAREVRRVLQDARLTDRWNSVRLQVLERLRRGRST
jgi:ribokinase